MNSTTLSDTAKKAVDAYGGAELWSRAQTVAAVVSVTGLAFTLKRRPFFDQARVSVKIHEPYCRLTPIGQDPSVAGVLDGGTVRLENAEGRVLSEDTQARNRFDAIAKLFRWDDLDMAYFANYAFWNYLTLPALLMRDDVIWREPQPGVLEAQFPEHLPTHSRLQRFTFDPESGRLRQHDYTADVISRLARAANVVTAHRQAGNLSFIAGRRVTPRRPSGSPMGFPELINIVVHEFAVER